MLSLNAAQIDGDFAFQFEVGLLAEIMHEQHVFGRNRGVGLELEDPMAVRLLQVEQRLGRARDARLQRVQRNGIGGRKRVGQSVHHASNIRVNERRIARR